MYVMVFCSGYIWLGIGSNSRLL